MASDVLDTVRAKVEAADRITNDEALFLMREANILDLAPLAQTVRRRHNPQEDVTFVVDTNLNYTNVCDAYCTFCAFYRTERDDDAYTHSVDEVMEMLGQARDKGVTTVLMQGRSKPQAALPILPGPGQRVPPKIPGHPSPLLLGPGNQENVRGFEPVGARRSGPA